MTGWKDWQIGEVVTESDFQNLVQDQVVQRYADSSERSTTLGTAVAEGMISYLEDTNSVEVYDGASWNGVGGALDDGTSGYSLLSNGTAGYVWQPVSHNYIINGAFDFWQRGTSFSAANAYTADRWTKNYATAFTTETISQQSFTSGELEVAGFGGDSFYLRQAITTVGSSTRSSIIQNIEDVRTLAGQTVTLSFYAKADSSRNLAGLFLIQDFGSGGSADVATGLSGTTIELTTSWQRFSKTVTLPSVSGKTIGSSSFLQVRIDMPRADGSTLDIWGVQLEAGSVATPFKRHAPSLALEEEACRRYYYEEYILNNWRAFGFAVDTNSARVMVETPTAMRATPTVVFTGDWRLARSAAINITGVTLSTNAQPSTNAKFKIETRITTPSATLTVGQGAALIGGSGGAKVTFTSEL